MSGRHARPTWADLTPEEKAEEFDRQWSAHYARAEEKRQRGEYPYDCEPRGTAR
jgi:hypothetical protein